MRNTSQQTQYRHQRITESIILFNRKLLFTLLCFAFLTACGQAKLETTPTDIIEPTTSTVQTTTPTEVPTAVPVDPDRYFSLSIKCTICHSQMIDASGYDVSIDKYWRASMMANSARDPYWQASVREEILNFPDSQTLIEETCARCHMPMASVTLSGYGEQTQILGEGLTNIADPLHSLAMDGVSCTLCHQITEEILRDPLKFNGTYEIDLETEQGERLLYSRFEVDENDSVAMQATSGFIPVVSEHITDSRHCATCHTLFTPVVDASSGTITGSFPEQTPFLEWFRSDYVDTHSCQHCHMPIAEGEVLTSITGGRARSPFYQHFFAGGNAYMLAIFQENSQELDTAASSSELMNAQQRILSNLQENAADISIADIQQNGNEIVVSLDVEALTGHKLPTGFPSRRVWIHLVITDEDGNIVFESGKPNQDGSISGNANDSDPGEFEPHYQNIEEEDQVQIYEAIIVDTEGIITTTLLSGARYVKDNRILPRGFEPLEASADILVLGQASYDTDFTAGGDGITYRILLDESIETCHVEASLLYQAIGYRWIENLLAYQADEITRFGELTQTVVNEPVTLAQDERSFEPEFTSYDSTIETSDIRISVVYDNLQYTAGFQPDWGFGVFIEYNDKLILFDTGGNGQILMDNIEQFGIDPARIEKVIFSHIHGDHTGGIDALLDAGARPTVYVLPSFDAGFKRRLAERVEVIEVSRGMQIDEGMYTTGEILDVVPEQALVLQTDRGLIVITGCAHPGVANMVDRAVNIFDSPVHLVMGGFHLTNAGHDVIRDIISHLRSLEVQWISPCHCTGAYAMSLFADEFGDRYIQCGAGLILVPDMPSD